MEKINNINNSATLNLNAKIYPIEVIFSVAYVFLDKAYFIFDGCPEEEIILEIKAKEQNQINKIVLEFYNELVSYADYKHRADETKIIREVIIKRALLTNVGEEEQNISSEESTYQTDSEMEDINEILKPWEEKNNTKNKQDKENKSNINCCDY